MPYLVFDTETTGLLKFDQPDDAEGQPRLASFAMLHVNDELQVTAAFHGLVQPTGWTMPLEAERINGLTTEMLIVGGTTISWPLCIFEDAILSGRTLVAHNLAYDRRVMRGELKRRSMQTAEHVPHGICTMQGTTKACAIPGPRGLKWPKLIEAIPILLGREFNGAHGALADAMGCLDLLRWIKAQEKRPEEAA